MLLVGSIKHPFLRDLTVCKDDGVVRTMLLSPNLSLTSKSQIPVQGKHKIKSIRLLPEYMNPLIGLEQGLIIKLAATNLNIKPNLRTMFRITYFVYSYTLIIFDCKNQSTSTTTSFFVLFFNAPLGLEVKG